MDSPQETLIKVLESLEKRQNATADFASKTTKDLYERVDALMWRCNALESIQIRLLNVLSETNAPAHLQILGEVKAALLVAEEKGISMGPPVDHFLSLLDEKSEKNVHLRIVPKRAAPVPPKSDP